MREHSMCILEKNTAGRGNGRFKDPEAGVGLVS